MAPRSRSSPSAAMPYSRRSTCGRRNVSSQRPSRKVKGGPSRGRSSAWWRRTSRKPPSWRWKATASGRPSNGMPLTMTRRPALRRGGASGARPWDYAWIGGSGDLLEARRVGLGGEDLLAAVALAADDPLGRARDGGHAERHALDLEAGAGLRLDRGGELGGGVVLQLRDREHVVLELARADEGDLDRLQAVEAGAELEARRAVARAVLDVAAHRVDGEVEELAATDLGLDGRHDGGEVLRGQVVAIDVEVAGGLRDLALGLLDLLVGVLDDAVRGVERAVRGVVDRGTNDEEEDAGDDQGDDDAEDAAGADEEHGDGPPGGLVVGLRRTRTTLWPDCFPAIGSSP